MSGPGAELRARLAEPGILVLPGVHDALSARIAVRTGFGAVAAGGNAATGTLLGAPDMGQLGMRDFADHYGRIAAAAGVPVLVDADTGFGGVHNVAQTVRAFERAGTAGLFIEDQVTPKRCGYLAGKAVVPVADQVAKLRAALDARRDADFVLCARTDALGVEGIDAAIDRAGQYKQTGVDMVFVQGADTAESLRQRVRCDPGAASGQCVAGGGGDEADGRGGAGGGGGGDHVPDRGLSGGRVRDRAGDAGAAPGPLTGRGGRGVDADGAIQRPYGSGGRAGGRGPVDPGRLT